MNPLVRTVLDLVESGGAAGAPAGAAPLDVHDIVLVLGHDTAEIATELARRLPDVTVHVLPVSADDPATTAELPPNVRLQACTSVWDRVHHVAGLPRPQVIVESGNGHKGQKLACFREMFLLLEPGGWYVVDRLADVEDPALHDVPGETVLELLARLDGAPANPGADAAATAPKLNVADAELRESASAIVLSGDAAYVCKRNRHLFKLRDARAAEILTRRLGDSWGAVVETRPAYSYPSRASVTVHGKGPVHGPGVVKVPEQTLRRYTAPVVLPRQRIIMGDFYLPETFRHHLGHRLLHHTMVCGNAALDRLISRWDPTPTDLPGSYMYLDTEYPGHYGHVMTEVISRYHGWTEARRLDPGVRPLISLREGQTEAPGYQLQLLDALGIPRDEVAYIPFNAAVRPEVLYAVTPGFSMPHYADLALGALYAEIGRRLHTPHLETPERIFVSRRPGGWRTCHNLPEVEEWFVREGYTVVYPEDHSFGDQISIFRQARRIAGFGGSGMFSLMFAPGARCVLLSGNANTANNEYLIGSVIGLDLHYFWSPSDIQHPKGGWTDEAFHSGFTFELDRFGDEILATLDS
ncbi:glycosyltransferase family 61 protein [Humibacillus xanthopallidus]|uniref:Capsular polysaccharide biosynthesis protein n=1 Tax=Humibacillus xanthopallidus TaxID=412689 RepID=A0A543HVJ9_9MICO|nr:glycosyltransferase family 61 protein [Humibacillus xanthopallidus]TQM62269.1 capsular polysaccharide biosynthesis protein [Humibacillus xanthopallidus]